MQSTKIKSTPWFIQYASVAFSLVAIIFCSVSLQIKILLCAGVVGWTVIYQYYFAHQVKFFQWLATNQWLLIDNKNQSYMTELLNSSYLSRYLIILNWKKHHAILCRWHYDAETWRHWQFFLRQNHNRSQ